MLFRYFQQWCFLLLLSVFVAEALPPVEWLEKNTFADIEQCEDTSESEEEEVNKENTKFLNPAAFSNHLPIPIFSRMASYHSNYGSPALDVAFRPPIV